MSSRHTQTLTVALRHELGDEHVELIVKAISLLDGVTDVVKGEPASFSDYAARSDVRREVRMAIYKAVDAVLNKGRP